MKISRNQQGRYISTKWNDVLVDLRFPLSPPPSLSLPPPPIWWQIDYQLSLESVRRALPSTVIIRWELISMPVGSL